MSKDQIEQITEEIIARLTPEKLWAAVHSCRAVCVREDAERVRYIVECGAERIGIAAGVARPPHDLAAYIDHTLLKPDATAQEVDTLCQEALEFSFAAVCVNPVWVRRAARRLAGSPVRTCTVAGFPLGATLPDAKAYEARRSIFDGAREIDMVVNLGAVKSGQQEVVRADIRGVVAACHDEGAICKVILETALLTEEEKVWACEVCRDAGADFVKTSTGFGPGGATAEDVALMRRVVGPDIGVKAAGGIRDSEATRQMLEAGATRIGASAGVRIVQSEAATPGY